jgi:hypothetical protein
MIPLQRSIVLVHASLKKKPPFKWTNEMQKTFNKMCLLMADDVFAAYPTTITSLTYTLMPLTST